MARVLRQFSRFAEYEDLKDLRNRITPIVAKLELKIADFTQDYENTCSIIRRFDEVLL